MSEQKREKARQLLTSAISGIEEELTHPGEVLAYDLSQQHLRQVREELARMLHEVETGQIDRSHQEHTWIGHVVVDGWPLKHPLTDLVLRAESAYLKLTR